MKLDEILAKLHSGISDNTRIQRKTSGTQDELSFCNNGLSNRVLSLEGAFGKITTVQIKLKRTNEVVWDIYRTLEHVSQQEEIGLTGAVQDIVNPMINNLLIKETRDEGNEP